MQVAAQLIEVFPPASHMHQFNESCYITNGNVGQDLEGTAMYCWQRSCLSLRSLCGEQPGDVFLRAGHNAIDHVDQRSMRLALDTALAAWQARQGDADVPRIGPQ